jgi:hypothetical protein
MRMAIALPRRGAAPHSLARSARELTKVPPAVRGDGVNATVTTLTCRSFPSQVAMVPRSSRPTRAHLDPRVHLAIGQWPHASLVNDKLHRTKLAGIANPLRISNHRTLDVVPELPSAGCRRAAFRLLRNGRRPRCEMMSACQHRSIPSRRSRASRPHACRCEHPS